MRIVRPRHKTVIPARAVLAEALESRLFLSASVSNQFSAAPTFIDLGPVSQLNSFSATGVQPLNLSAPFIPSQIRSAYGVNLISLNGTTGNGAGQTIAIVDAYNDPNIIADTNSFSSNFGLSQFNGAGEPTLKVLNESGGTSLADVPNSTPGGWDVEESLDVEWAHSIAPEANIVLFEANSNSGSDLFTAVATAADYAGVSMVSMSWGDGEFAGESSLDSYFTTPSGHQGVTFVASAGDSGDIPSYPSESPNVISVGGTSLTINSDGSYGGESAWSGGGGGLSADESQPSYQVGKVNSLTTAARAAPDVAMDASPNTGVQVLDTYYYAGYLGVGGTSAAAPMWAGLISIADQGRALQGLQSLNGHSQTLPDLYNLSPSYFHDVISGSNGQSATVGYDLATGLGSPIANLLVPALAGYPTGPKLAFATQPPSSVMSGSSMSSIVVDVESANGSLNTSDNSNVTLSVSNAPARASLNGTVTVAASGGVATFSGLSLDEGGTYTLEASDGNLYVALSNPITVVPVAPQVLSTQVGNGSAQRSTISSISVTFNAPVLLGSNPFTLYQEVLNPDGSIDTGASPNNVTDDVTGSLTNGAATLTIAVTPGGALDRTGSDDAGFFVNGIYQLVLNGAGIADSTGSVKFDSGASTAAIFASNETGTGTSPYFHVLFGDLTGSGTVNAGDLRTLGMDFASSVGDSNYNAALDYNGTGTINAISLRAFDEDYAVSYVY